MVQNTAPREWCRISNCDNIIPTLKLLKSLHWLPVEFRIRYKICLLTLNSLHSHEPKYLSEMLTPRTIHYGLKLQVDKRLVMPRTKRTM